MEQVDLCEIIRRDSDIDHAWENWVSRVEGIVNDNVPTVTIKDQSGPPWMNSEVRHRHTVKQTAWSRAKRTSKSSDWSTFKNIGTNLGTT